MFKRVLQWLFGEPLAGRSPQWPAARAEHLKRHPECECCGTKDNLEVHHLRPVNAYPELELDPGNMRTVCHDHHFLVGHGCDYKAWNPKFDVDAFKIREMIKRRKYGR